MQLQSNAETLRLGWLRAKDDFFNEDCVHNYDIIQQDLNIVCETNTRIMMVINKELYVIKW